MTEPAPMTSDRSHEEANMHNGYPVILNGDHAEFEQEWAGKDPKTRPDWPTPSFDARDWAQAFLAKHPNCGLGEGDMIGWFANALMRGYDQPRGSQ